MREKSTRQTSFEKIWQTAKALREPRDGAEGMALGIATLCQGLSSPQARTYLEGLSDSGELDPLLHALSVWLAGHIGDDNEMLLIVPVPRHRPLKPGALLHRCEMAREIALAPPPDILKMTDDDEEPRELTGAQRQRLLMQGVK